MAIGCRCLLGQGTGTRSLVAVTREHRLGRADQRIRSAEQDRGELVRFHLESRGSRRPRPAQNVGPDRVQLGFAIRRLCTPRSLFRSGAVVVLDPPSGVAGGLLGRIPVIGSVVRGTSLESIGPGRQGVTENGASDRRQLLGFVERLERLVYTAVDIVASGSVVVSSPGVSQSGFRTLEQARRDEVQVLRTSLLDAFRGPLETRFDALGPQRGRKEDGECDDNRSQAGGIFHLSLFNPFVSWARP